MPRTVKASDLTNKSTVFSTKINCTGKINLLPLSICSFMTEKICKALYKISPSFISKLLIYPDFPILKTAYNTNKHKHTHTCPQTHTHTHTHMHACMHRHTHTHTHTHTWGEETVLSLATFLNSTFNLILLQTSLLNSSKEHPALKSCATIQRSKQTHLLKTRWHSKHTNVQASKQYGKQKPTNLWNNFHFLATFNTPHITTCEKKRCPDQIHAQLIQLVSTISVRVRECKPQTLLTVQMVLYCTKQHPSLQSLCKEHK